MRATGFRTMSVGFPGTCACAAPAASRSAARSSPRTTGKRFRHGRAGAAGRAALAVVATLRRDPRQDEEDWGAGRPSRRTPART